jgi:DNA-directed RNA polymerase subunit RPC12/RpoP
MRVVTSGPQGGDIAEGYECNECGSENVLYEEYQGDSIDESILGIRCEDCGGYEDPWLFGLRHEPEWNPEYKKGD